MKAQIRKSDHKSTHQEKLGSKNVWTPEQRRNRLNVIEQDIRSLMRRLAEVDAAGREKEKRTTENLKQLLLSLLDVSDSFERIFASINAKKDACTPQMNIWLGNFRTVYRLLNKTLIEQGISPIENLDQGFDPHWHEVERTILDPSRPEGTIVEEVKRGYFWHSKELLRRARLVVVTHTRPEVTEQDDAALKVSRRETNFRSD